jgi:shikimate 5-dehydrogenase
MGALLAGPGGIVAPFPPAPGSWDLLVNATPVGTWPHVHETPVPGRLLEGGGLVYDLVYNPPVTRLLREAAAAGCRTIGGIEMLIAQAERQFEWWTGQPPASGLFRKVAHASHVV